MMASGPPKVGLGQGRPGQGILEAPAGGGTGAGGAGRGESRGEPSPVHEG